MALKSIFNFAPLNKKVYTPAWSDKLAKDVSQDAPFADGEDGIITFDITNMSPMFIRNKDKDDVIPCHIDEKDGKCRFMIPGTSIKGMLRSTMEVFSFAKMTQYQDRYFSENRDFGTKTRNDSKAKPHCGWIFKRDDDYYIKLCCNDFDKIRIKEMPTKPYGATNYERNKSLAVNGKWYPEYNGMRIVCTGGFGKPDSKNCKKHEYLFPDEKDTYNDEKLPEEVVTKFLSVYANTDGFDKYLDRLKKGLSVPVFVLMDDEENITLIGQPRNMRIPFNKGVRQLVLDYQEKKENPDLCETIFGYVNKYDSSMRGRVQIAHAFTEPVNKESALMNLVSGVLGTPKASYYPLYLKQDGNKYKTYDNAKTIAGRKFYRVRCADVTEELINNGKKNVLSHFRPLKKGQTFKCRINVHNLKPVEIGAILSSLLLHNAQGVYHNMGMAKGYGYGKIKVENVQLDSLSKSVNEYLKIFENEMDAFLGGSGAWRKSEEVTTLLQILSEHAPSTDLGVMNMEKWINGKKINEFREAKNFKNFDTLQERNKVVIPEIS